MSLTHYPHGLSSFGMPVMGGGMLPLMGGRIAATGDAKVYFVDPANGSDGNTGLSPDRALDTVSAALALTVDKSGDTIYLLNDGNTSGTSREDTTITWSNDNVHLVGLCSGSMISQRARIGPTSAQSTTVTPMITVSGSGCYFANFSLFEDSTEAADNTCVTVTGARNVFNNVAFMNMGSATASTAATRAGSNVLDIQGDENFFKHCYIGLDTIARTAANNSVKFSTSAERTMFEDCFFPMRATNAGVIFVYADTSNAIDRFALFKNCMFHNATNSGGTSLTEVCNIHASVNGSIIMQNTHFFGADKWEDTSSTNLILNMPIVDAADVTGGEFIAAT